MIFGECPYCKFINATAIAPKCPAVSKETCDGCEKDYWLQHSRLDPVAYPIDYFKVVDGKLLKN